MDSPPSGSSSVPPVGTKTSSTTVSRGTQTRLYEETSSSPPSFTSASERTQGLPSGDFPHTAILRQSVLQDQLEDTLPPEVPQIPNQSIAFSLIMARHSAPSHTSANHPPQYQLVTPGSNNDPRAMSQNSKDQLVHSLRTHKVNTITELRRIEKIFAYLDSSEVTEPMTAAWAHYVNSNNLLNELRGLTKSYPFSSECLDEAKALVVRDPQSVRSWNYCWLVLLKMEKEGLVTKHARALASKPAMWGGRTPTAEGIQRLANACVTEWTRALRQMLRHWDRPPSTTGI